MLLAYNRKMGCSSKTEEQIKKLADPRSVAVLTGQQAGLCTGPLYTVYKAISAVKLSQKLELQWGRPVVPIFWIASEDHDFSEANHFSLLDRENRLQRIRLEVEHKGEPVGMLTLDKGAAARVVEELAGHVQISEFSEAALDFLRDTAEASATPAQWFARIFSILFADRGLVLFDPLLPESRRMLIPFYLKAVERVAEAGETLREREQALLAAGYPLQVEREEEASLLMYISGKRSALYRRGSDFATRDGAAVFSKESLCRLIEEEPEKISPNVLLRPLAQDSLFPTIVYIPGAGEFSYFAQLLPLYRIFGLTPPVLQPRGGLTVIEPRLKRYLERYGLPEQDILGGLDGYLKKTLTAKAGVDLDAVFGRLRGKIEEEYRLLRQELSRLDGQLPGLTDKNMQRVWTEIEYLRQKAEQQAKKKNETVVRHFDNLEQALLPLGRLQERVLNIFPFMIKYGPDFGQKIYREFPAEPGHHLFYYEQTSV
jgi:bacillithiol synthase